VSSLVVREFRAYIVRKISLPGSGLCFLPGLEKKTEYLGCLKKRVPGNSTRVFYTKNAPNTQIKRTSRVCPNANSNHLNVLCEG
jgi:hypothetical protein